MGAVTRLRAAGRHLVMGWDSTIARHERLTTSDDLLQCTPRAARRCVLHGACACRTHPDHEWGCQLHSPISSHGIEHIEVRP